jgi:hypothetical protein
VHAIFCIKNASIYVRKPILIFELRAFLPALENNKNKHCVSAKVSLTDEKQIRLKKPKLITS